jgi:hypothetical protein
VEVGLLQQLLLVVGPLLYLVLLVVVMALTLVPRRA